MADRSGKQTVNRRVREETVHINGCPVKFYRCHKKKRWHWRALGGKIRLPKDGR